MTAEKYCAIYVDKSLDYEETSAFNITVQMIIPQHTSQPKLSSTQIRINVEDVNDNEPKFVLPSEVFDKKMYSSLTKDIPQSTRIAEVKVSSCENVLISIFINLVFYILHY